jgi:hypothetical protein
MRDATRRTVRVVRRARRSTIAGRAARRSVLAHTLCVATVGAALAAGVAFAQECPARPGDAFAFLRLAEPCPPTPLVRFAAPRVTIACDPLADPAHAIDCGESPAGCVDRCRAAAASWNAPLAGRFTFQNADAGTPVAFCDPDDGRTSIVGSATLCDGSAFASNVLAVAYRITFVNGPRAGEQVDVDITVNTAARFADYFRQPRALQATLSHELGHVLGLDHPDQCGKDFNVLMRSGLAFGPSSPCFVTGPTADDVHGAELVWPQVGPPPVCGDADGSGTLSVTDGVQVLRAAAELSSSCSLALCDVDGSGAVSVVDGVNVLRAAAELPATLQCPP